MCITGRNALYSQCRYDANRRKLLFDLSIEEFLQLISNTCYYCGIKPKTKLCNGKYKVKAHGLDRINNNLGYTSKNCVACCKTCNYAKRDMSTKDFEKWLDRIVNFRKGIK